jgi:hypothetical protein
VKSALALDIVHCWRCIQTNHSRRTTPAVPLPSYHSRHVTTNRDKQVRHTTSKHFAELHVILKTRDTFFSSQRMTGLASKKVRVQSSQRI